MTDTDKLPSKLEGLNLPANIAGALPALLDYLAVTPFIHRACKALDLPETSVRRLIRAHAPLYAVVQDAISEGRVVQCERVEAAIIEAATDGALTKRITVEADGKRTTEQRRQEVAAGIRYLEAYGDERWRRSRAGARAAESDNAEADALLTEVAYVEGSP